MVLEVTKGPQGPLFSVNGSPARPLPWTEGLKFQQGGAVVSFVQNGNGGPATMVTFQSGAAYYVLKRQ